jgi:hypothetical protein
VGGLTQLDDGVDNTDPDGHNGFTQVFDDVEKVDPAGHVGPLEPVLK